MEEQPAPSAGGPTPAPKSKALWIVVAVIVVVVVVLAAAVLGGLFNPAKPALRIGTLLSLTGGLSLFGPGDQLGADLAVSEINKAGGVLGQNIQVFHEDDQTVSSAAAAAASKLITVNKVNAIVGAQFSGGSLAALPIAIDNGVVMVSPSATSVRLSDLTVTKGWFSRSISSDALQGFVAASYLAKNASFKFANVMVINNAYGNGLGAVFKTQFEKMGGKVNDTVVIEEKQADYSAKLTQLFQTKPPVVYFVAYPDTGQTVMKQWQAGPSGTTWKTQWVFSEGLDDQEFINNIRAPAVGVDVTKVWGTAPAAPVSTLYNDFVARYKAATFNRTPVLYASHSYDAVYMIALAAQKAGAVDGASIKANLRAISGPSGTVINGGQWAKAVSTLAGGGAVNWEGASGSQDLNATNDPGKGSYEVWGVNSTFQIFRKAFFGETLIAPLGGPLGAAVRSEGAPGFLGQLRVAAILRQD
jgi:ABC-type branched-subunit amino acid transport system substrate-binding protein